MTKNERLEYEKQWLKNNVGEELMGEMTIKELCSHVLGANESSFSYKEALEDKEKHNFVIEMMIKNRKK